jgi:hypothetical protein
VSTNETFTLLTVEDADDIITLAPLLIAMVSNDLVVVVHVMHVHVAATQTLGVVEPVATQTCRV